MSAIKQRCEPKFLQDPGTSFIKTPFGETNDVSFDRVRKDAIRDLMLISK